MVEYTVGATFIQWAWEPPVIDGGLVVTDYEISYTAKISEFDKSTGKYKKWEEHVPSLRTSQWCFAANPVCNHGFRMTMLRANTEYTQFRIRCCNLRGWSVWADMIRRDEYDEVTNAARSSSTTAKSDWHQKMDNDGGSNLSTASKLVVNTSVFTHVAENPSCPLFFACTLVTSSCIHLNWQAPYYDGGSEVIDYNVHYTELEKQVTVTARDVIVQHKKVFRTHSGTATEAVIRNIFPDTDVVNIYIEAVNKEGLVGEKVFLKYNNSAVLHTSKSCRFSQLSRELAMATASVEMFIDSAFFTVHRIYSLLHMHFLLSTTHCHHRASSSACTA